MFTSFRARGSRGDAGPSTAADGGLDPRDAGSGGLGRDLAFVRRACSFGFVAVMPYLALIFGVFCCSTSVIFIRSSATDPVLLAAYRLLLGAAFLLPAYLRAARKHPDFRLRWTDRTTVWMPALLLAVHFISWIFGARETPAANATLLVNMTPAVMPIMLWFIAREVITVGEGIGTTIALLGVVLLVGADLSFADHRVLGDLVCFGSMVLYTGYLAFARRNRAIPSIYLYVVPLYAVAGLLCLPVAGAQMVVTGDYRLLGPELARELVAVLGLAIVPTVFGHSLINRAFKHLRGQAVSTINLSQVIFAAALAALLLGEIPEPPFYAAALLILGGAVTVVRAGRPGR